MTGRQFQVELLRQFQRVEFLHEHRGILVAERLADLHHQLATPTQWRGTVGVGFLAGLQPWLAGMTAAACVAAHIGRAAKAGDAIGGNRGGIALQVDLQAWQPMNMSHA